MVVRHHVSTPSPAISEQADPPSLNRSPPPITGHLLIEHRSQRLREVCTRIATAATFRSSDPRRIASIDRVATGARAAGAPGSSQTSRRVCSTSSSRRRHPRPVAPQDRHSAPPGTHYHQACQASARRLPAPGDDGRGSAFPATARSHRRRQDGRAPPQCHTPEQERSLAAEWSRSRVTHRLHLPRSRNCPVCARHRVGRWRLSLLHATDARGFTIDLRKGPRSSRANKEQAARRYLTCRFVHRARPWIMRVGLEKSEGLASRPYLRSPASGRSSRSRTWARGLPTAVASSGVSFLPAVLVAPASSRSCARMAPVSVSASM